MRGRFAVPLFGLLVGCTTFEERPEATTKWDGDVEALLSVCEDCHQVKGYASLMRCKEDGSPWVRPGDPESVLLKALDRPDHAGFLDESARRRVERWIVEDGAIFRSDLAHPAGFAAPASSSFHGAALRADGHRALIAGECARCHDRPPELGGATPCESCHAVAFTGDRCDGCHGDGDPLPRVDPCDTPDRRAAVGAHGLHTDPSRDPAFPAIPCDTCHQVPESLDSPGHLQDGSSRAEVTFARDWLAGATWDPATRTCGNIRCHAGRSVVWTDAPSGETCDRCHGAPPPDHVSDRCSFCHAAAFDADGMVVGARHLDGEVQTGSACGDCHQQRPETGGHAVHLKAGPFTTPAACSDCHVVPTDRDDPGHIDSDLPAEVTLVGLRATAGELSPVFERGRCSNVACHGAHLEDGAARTGDWVDPGTLACGDCHGLPPVVVRGGAARHLPTGPAECGVCHRTEAGAPITAGTSSITAAGRTAHIDGCVDLERGCPP